MRINLRRVVPAAVVAVVASSVAAAAVTSSGFHDRQLTLDDAGIWTAQANSTDADNPGSFVGRANPGAGVIDTAVSATPRPQLLQNGPHVIFHDAASGSVTSIDTDLGTTGSPLSVPVLTAPTGTVPTGTPPGPDGETLPTVDLNAAGEVGLGDDTVGVIDQGTGKLYVLRADALPSGPLAAQRAVATLAKNSRLVVGVDGVVHVVSPRGDVDDFSADGRKLRHSSIGVDLTRVTTPGTPFTVSAVGGRAVVLDGSNGVYVEGHNGSIASVDGGSAAPLLQQPGDTRPTVLIATGSSLDTVDLGSGVTKVLTAKGLGPPAAPVFVPERGCSYGAWAGRAAIPADASTTGSPAVEPTAVKVCDDGQTYAGPGEQNPVWRVNHGSALLNDEVSGHNLFFGDGDPQEIADWTQAQRPGKTGDSTSASTTTLTPQQQPAPGSGADHPRRRLTTRSPPALACRSSPTSSPMTPTPTETCWPSPVSLHRLRAEPRPTSSTAATTSR